MSGKRSYDVFLSYNSADKQAVETLARQLVKEGNINPFFDKWCIKPGDLWQEKLEEGLDNSQTCAIFIGPDGISPWQNEEMRSALDDRVKQSGFRVIPVLLPGACEPGSRRLPRFVRRLQCLDFRAGLDNPEKLRSLVAVILYLPQEPPVVDMSWKVWFVSTLQNYLGVIIAIAIPICSLLFVWLIHKILQPPMADYILEFFALPLHVLQFIIPIPIWRLSLLALLFLLLFLAFFFYQAKRNQERSKSFFYLIGVSLSMILGISLSTTWFHDWVEPLQSELHGRVTGVEEYSSVTIKLISFDNQLIENGSIDDENGVFVIHYRPTFAAHPFAVVGMAPGCIEMPFVLTRAQVRLYASIDLELTCGRNP